MWGSPLGTLNYYPSWKRSSELLGRSPGSPRLQVRGCLGTASSERGRRAHSRPTSARPAGPTSGPALASALPRPQTFSPAAPSHPRSALGGLAARPRGSCGSARSGRRPGPGIRLGVGNGGRVALPRQPPDPRGHSPPPRRPTFIFLKTFLLL